jgi:O-antigen/teichoic acid export membrane protein
MVLVSLLSGIKSFINKSMSKKIINQYSFLTNTKWLMLEKIFRIILSFSVSIWLANYLGVENFGFLNYALSFALIFSSLLTLGLDKYLPKEIVLNPQKEDEVLGSSLHLRLIGSVFMLIVTGLASYFFQNEKNPNFMLLVIIISIGYTFRVFDILKYWFESHMISIYSLAAQSSALVISNLAKILFIFMDLDVVYFAIAIAMEYIVQASMLIYFYKKFRKTEHFFNFSLKKSINILKITWPLIFASFLTDIYSKVDIIMLGKLSSNENVGLYTVATKICTSWLFIPTTIAIAYYPALLDILKRNRTEEFKKVSTHLMNLIISLSLFISIVFTVFSREVISLLFSAEYIDSAGILSIYIWGTIFISISSITNRIFVAKDLTNFILNRAIIGFIVNIGLNFILIPTYGGMGAALSTVFSLFLTLFVLNFINSGTRNIFYLQVKAFNFMIFFKSYTVIRNLK